MSDDDGNERTWTVKQSQIEHDTKHLNALIASMLAGEEADELVVRVEQK